MGGVRITEEQFNATKAALRTLPPRSKGLGDIYKIIGVSPGSVHRIRTSKTYDEFKKSQRPSQPTEMTLPFHEGASKDEVLNFKLKIVNAKLDEALKILNRIKPKYLEREGAK